MPCLQSFQTCGCLFVPTESIDCSGQVEVSWETNMSEVNILKNVSDVAYYLNSIWHILFRKHFLILT